MDFLSSIPTNAWIVWAIVLIPGWLLYTRIYTQILYWWGTYLAHTAPKKDKPIRPPTLPYSIPLLGSTLSFATQTPGKFWRYLQSKCHRAGLDAMCIVLNATPTHLIFSPAAVSSIFKARTLSRFRLDQQLGRNVLGMSSAEAEKTFPDDLDAKEQLTTERIHSAALLSTSAVNSLTSRFMQEFTAQLAHDKLDSEIELYAWLRDHMLRASTISLCGSTILELVPNLASDFWKWDDGLIGMLFGTPRLFAKEAYAARDRLLDGLTAWLEAGYAATKNDTEDADWEPHFGARVMHKRHFYYRQQNMNLRTEAGADLIFLGGILSNAIPATGWLLMHLLDPQTGDNVLTDVMAELRTAHRADGTVDIATLTSLPLLNSMFHEVLRLYVDLLVTRRVDAQTTLDAYSVGAGEMVMAPTWMLHRNAAFFSSPDTFQPRRFLVTDPETGMVSCKTDGLGGKYFPFGGGHYMCPGRTFAKQEVLGAVAVVLLGNEIECRGWKDGKGFPRLKGGFAGNVVVGLEGDMKVRIASRRV